MSRQKKKSNRKQRNVETLAKLQRQQIQQPTGQLKSLQPVASSAQQKPAKQSKSARRVTPSSSRQKPARQSKSARRTASSFNRQQSTKQLKPSQQAVTTLTSKIRAIQPVKQRNVQRSLLTPPEKISETKETSESTSHITLRIFAICIAPIAICINFSNYASLIPLLQSKLHVDNGQIGLFSTLLFLGIALTNIPGGILSDRYGSRATMLGSLALVTTGTFLFPLFPNFTWMILCRALIGLGSGAALVAGSHAAAELGKYSALGQGLNGGAAQLGAGLGLFITPQLLGLIGWRGALLAGGIPGIVALLVWLWVPQGEHVEDGTTQQQNDPAAGIRSPIIWSLGLANMGTFGLGNAITAWLAVYFLHVYGLPLGLAATLGSLGLFAGILFRPLGGILLERWQRPLLLIRAGAVLTFIGVGLLAFPIASLPLALGGLFLLALGVTLPYASIFSTAAMVGKKTSIGSGVAQGLIAVLASPAAIVGTPVMGILIERTGSFPVTFGSIGLVIPGIGVLAAFILGLMIKRLPKVGSASIA